MSGFFGKAWEAVVGIIEDINKGLTSFLKKTRVNTELKEVQKKKVNLLLNLGELVYNLYQNERINIDECKGMCDEITAYNEKLARLQIRAKEIDDEKLVTGVGEKQALPETDTGRNADDTDDFDIPMENL